MKKNTIILLLLFTFLIKSKAQVVISPEIGLSYSPFLIDHGAFSSQSKITYSERLDLVVGFSAQFPIHESWYMDTRLTYQGRRPSEWRECGALFCSNYDYKHSNLNLDLRLYRKITPTVSLGLGPSLIRKFKSDLTAYNHHGQDETIVHKRIFNDFGVLAGVSFDFNRIKLNLDYTYTMSSNHLLFFSRYRSRSRLNLTLSYPLRTGK